ncbi:hypothetical protein PVK06_037195 [Gossypium arboreum]|uniref:Uncharacterized protein n=1 Tax=Gossypium arboreum TaxID=29729 RepID=A0ABR0MWL1_GOSAR|nr:hypothetical protein PVK06_037195 [Gossypium arboreum]
MYYDCFFIHHLINLHLMNAKGIYLRLVERAQVLESKDRGNILMTYRLKLGSIVGHTDLFYVLLYAGNNDVASSFYNMVAQVLTMYKSPVLVMFLPTVLV